MDNNDKNATFRELFLSGVRSGLALYSIIWAFAIVLSVLNLFDFFQTLSAYGNMIMGAVLFILGMPLTILLRLDMIGKTLGIDNTQLLLFLGSIVTCFNIAIVLGGREVLIGSVKKMTSRRDAINRVSTN